MREHGRRSGTISERALAAAPHHLPAGAALAMRSASGCARLAT